MRRVLVLGSPGAGKSTFARLLASRTGLPLIHLDAEYHLPGWVEPSEEAWRTRVNELVGGECWIVDGNYGGTMDIRLACADAAILLDYPTWLCLWRALRRITALRGTVRSDAAPGCPEQLDWDFLRYIATFRGTKTPALERRLAGFGGTVVRFRHPVEAQAFLDALG